MRVTWIPLLACCMLLACDNKNSAIPKSFNLPADNGLAFDDPTPSASADGSLLQVNSRVESTSADGSEADLVLHYTVDPSVRAALTASSFIEFNYVAPGENPRTVAKEPLDEELRGTAEATVPTENEEATLVATLGGLLPSEADLPGIKTVEMPVRQKRNTTDLGLVKDVSVQLVDGSYNSHLLNGRRIHRFAVRVIDPTKHPVQKLLEAGRILNSDYSISGLEDEPWKYFSAREGGIDDSESPVTVSFEEHPLAVYMVIDTSSSIVESRQANNLSNAVSNAVIDLNENALFDYRKFNGTVSRISSIRELDFDSGESSATALYYALDTALSDIENFGSDNQDKIIMVFTDGKDLASRNYYNGDLIDHNQVHEYIVQRVSQVKASQQRSLGRQLDVYTLAFYEEQNVGDVAKEVEKLDSIALAGGTGGSYNNQELGDIATVFDAVVQNIRGVYYLEYSSQQTPDDTCLELFVTIGELEPAKVKLPNENRKNDCPVIQ